MRNWLLLISSLSVVSAGASESFVRSVMPVTDSDLPSLPWVQSYETFRIDQKLLSANLATAPMQSPSMKAFSVIGLPTPDGHIARFKVVESPTMSDALGKRIAVKTYKVVGIDDKYATGRLDWGINGFHGLVTSPNGSYTIDPPKVGNRDYVVVYFYRDNWTPKSGFQCHTPNDERQSPLQSFRVQAPLAGNTMKTTRMAVNANGEYTAFFGGQTAAEAAVVTTVNRLNLLYENEVAIHFNLVYVKAWTDANSDPFTNGDHGAMINQNQTELDATVGDANYDIGHIFSTTFGGLAALNSVGRTGAKALGSSGLPSPVGDLFDTWVVAHETGHQWGTPHTFAFCGSSTNGQEPGSGSTIMSYAGICGGDDVQSAPDPYFHGFSLVEIQEWRNDSRSGGTEASTGNTIPTADAGPDLTIPQNTPYKLTGIGTDANGDSLTYCWEQYEVGPSALYRSLPPSASPTRFFPKLATVLNGGTDRWEPMVTSDKTLTFRVTVRDNRLAGGGTAQDGMSLNVAGAPFQVTSPSGSTSWLGGANQTITWNVGGGTATNVNILFSADGGTSYGTGGATMLLANTPNDGSQAITVPQVATTSGRIIVEAVGNVYYNVNVGNITVTPTQVPVLTDFTLSSPSVVGGFSVQGTLTIDFAGAGEQVVTTTSTSPNAVVPPTVTIPTGQLTKNFAITTNSVLVEETATISAKLRSVTKTRTLQITRDVGPDNLFVTPSVIGGSARAIGTVHLTQPAPPGGVVVSMSDNGPELAVNPSVIVASGYQQQNFTVITNAVNAAVVRTITATRAGHTVTCDVTIVPLTINSFTIAPSGVVCGNAATATVMLNAPAPAAGVTVNLGVNSELLQTPASFTIPEGAISGTFPVGTLTTSVEVMRQVTLTYKAQKMTRNLIILPADISSLTIAPKTIKGGTNATGTITLNGTAGNGFVVNVSSNGPEVVVPATVTVPYSKSFANFQVQTLPVNNGRTRIVTITRNGRTRTFAVVITK